MSTSHLWRTDVDCAGVLVVTGYELKHALTSYSVTRIRGANVGIIALSSFGTGLLADDVVVVGATAL
tara:strand:- start:1110 stop:1310 length:201 start_codon:yes stop_codon:yes gene_type:complete